MTDRIQQAQESDHAHIEGPRPYRPFVSTEEAAKWMGLRVEEFEGLMRRLLPTVRQVAIGKRDRRWAWMDVATLNYVFFRSSYLFVSEDSEIEPKVKPEPLPKGHPIPDGLRPIADKLVAHFDGPSVYFLIQGSVVIYVGISTRPERRILDHKFGTKTTEQKIFDHYLIYPVSLGEMLETERNLVAILDPVLNRNLKQKPQ